MEVFLLGAGRPAQGGKPSALRKIALNTNAMDWQIHSFESVVDVNKIHFLGGYQINEVIERYSSLNYQVIPDWENSSVLHTFLKAPFSGQPILSAYSDTVFRKEYIQKLVKIDADVVFAIDSRWKERYESRTYSDIQSAETVVKDGQSVEFTGLMYFSAAVVKVLQTLSESDVGSTLIDLIDYLDDRGYSVATFDVAGHWAEFNSSRDISRFILGTKSETLARLEPLVKCSHIGKQVCFTGSSWQKNKTNILNNIQQKFLGSNLVIRSSSRAEDNWYSSNAGGFKSILNVEGDNNKKISQAIDDVIHSFGLSQTGDDQVLVQKCLNEVQVSGVIFTCDLESGAPYYRFNFDDKTQSTESVTAGTHSDLRTVILSRFSPGSLTKVAPELIPVLEATQELEQLLGFDKLDIEFAIAKSGKVHIFQVRPITVNHDKYDIDDEIVIRHLKNAASQIVKQQQPSPFVYGEKTIFANMPDWNPAEIIGTRPKPLAFSLYRYLITNGVWAKQRAEFGYRNVNPHPLLVALCGQPYIDCRASINSFIPATLSQEITERLANAYINILADNPKFHDKIEFDVLFTIWTPDFRTKAEARLIPYGVLSSDILELEDALKVITRQSLTRLSKDIDSINTLNSRRELIDNSKLFAIDKIFALLDDCKQYGTLAFSHAARAGFVATSLLNALVSSGGLANERRLQFLKSFATVSGEFQKDKHEHFKGNFGQQELLDKYGHLRPGTYDVTRQAYWEDPEHYLSITETNDAHQEDFNFSDSELSSFSMLLDELEAEISTNQLINYLIESVQAREFIKLEFTRNLSKAFDYCVLFGKEAGLSREELSFMEFNDLEQLKINGMSVTELPKLIRTRRQLYALTCAIELPPFITHDTDIFCFERFSSQPNFVSLNRIEGEVHCLNGDKAPLLKNKIILIPQADPGYDWLFGHGIAGLITQYGGANSHMAIRAAEIGLPAAIGVGEKLYDQIKNMIRIELDCNNQLIRKIE